MPRESASASVWERCSDPSCQASDRTAPRGTCRRITSAPSPPHSLVDPPFAHELGCIAATRTDSICLSVLWQSENGGRLANHRRCRQVPVEADLEGRLLGRIHACPDRLAVQCLRRRRLRLQQAQSIPDSLGQPLVELRAGIQPGSQVVEIPDGVQQEARVLGFLRFGFKTVLTCPRSFDLFDGGKSPHRHIKL